MGNRGVIFRVVVLIVLLIGILLVEKDGRFSTTMMMREIEKENFIGPGEVLEEFDFGNYSVFLLDYKGLSYSITIMGSVFDRTGYMNFVGEGVNAFTPNYKDRTYCYGMSDGNEVTITYKDEFYNETQVTTEVDNGYFMARINDEVRVTSIVDNNNTVLHNLPFPNDDIYESTIVTDDGMFLIDYNRITEDVVSVTLRIQDPMKLVTIYGLLFEMETEYARSLPSEEHSSKLGYGSIYIAMSFGTNSFDTPYIFTVYTAEGEYTYDFSDREIILKEDF